MGGRVGDVGAGMDVGGVEVGGRPRSGPRSFEAPGGDGGAPAVAIVVGRRLARSLRGPCPRGAGARAGQKRQQQQQNGTPDVFLSSSPSATTKTVVLSVGAGSEPPRGREDLSDGGSPVSGGVRGRGECRSERRGRQEHPSTQRFEGWDTGVLGFGVSGSGRGSFVLHELLTDRCNNFLVLFGRRVRWETLSLGEVPVGRGVDEW